MTRVGLVARADKTGLGVQTLEMYRHLQPAKTLVMDLSHIDRTRFAVDRTLFPDATWLQPRFPVLKSIPDDASVIERWLDDLDVIVACETFYYWRIIERARQRRVKTVLQYNFEFLDFLPRPDLPMVDVLAAPSLWHFDEVRAQFPNTVYLPVPVDRDRIPFRARSDGHQLLHVAGNHTGEDRNGTRIVLEAMRHVDPSVHLTVRSQHPVKVHAKVRNRVTVHGPADDYWTNFEGTESVFVMPRRFGGLCLPLNEALAAGMVPLMSDVSPQNHFLDPRSLVPTCGSEQLMTKAPIDVWDVDPVVLAERINHLAERPEVVAELSAHSDRLASQWSWDTLGPRYLELFEDLASGGQPWTEPSTLTPSNSAPASLSGSDSRTGPTSSSAA